MVCCLWSVEDMRYVYVFIYLCIYYLYSSQCFESPLIPPPPRRGAFLPLFLPVLLRSWLILLGPSRLLWVYLLSSVSGMIVLDPQ